MDVLAQLRTCIIDKTFKEIVLYADDGSSQVKKVETAKFIKFPSSSNKYALTTPTLLKTDLSAEASQFFDLSSVLFAYMEREKNYAEYFQECQKLNIKHVSLIIRKDLVEYLEGKTEEHAHLSNDSKHIEDAQKLAGGDYGDLRTEEDRNLNEQERKRLKLDADRTKDIISKEREIINRTTILVEQNAKSFEQHRKLAIDIILRGTGKRKEESASSSKSSSKPIHSASSSVLARSTTTSSSSVSKQKKAGEPIIIVPAAITSLITLFNVENFLTKSQFESTENVRQKQPVKPGSLKFEHVHERTGKKLTFHVVESIIKLEDWDRVVAVFCSGLDWQFRGWKWQEPVELFSNVKGFYIKYSDAKVENTVRGWNVQVLEVNRYKRHMDAQCVHLFWSNLDQWISLHKPQMLA